MQWLPGTGSPQLSDETAVARHRTALVRYSFSAPIQALSRYGLIHSSTEVLELLRSLSDEDGAAVVMVTHDQAAARYGSREVHLVDGRVSGVDVAAPIAEL